jgi:hypothetical protein
MQLDGFLFEEDTPTYVYALIGGVTGIVVVIVHNLVVGGEAYYSLNGTIIGSILAGFLARRGSGSFKKAGMGAGVIGTLPAFAWLSDTLRESVISFISEGPVFAAVIFCILVLAVVMWTAAIGAFGGFFGSWIAGKVAH